MQFTSGHDTCISMDSEMCFKTNTRKWAGKIPLEQFAGKIPLGYQGLLHHVGLEPIAGSGRWDAQKFDSGREMEVHVGCLGTPMPIY